MNFDWAYFSLCMQCVSGRNNITQILKHFERDKG